ncbi:MAG: hypothetical protein ACHP6I_01810 [Rickettsiales bacterium]
MGGITGNFMTTDGNDTTAGYCINYATGAYNVSGANSSAASCVIGLALN